MRNIHVYKTAMMLVPNSYTTQTNYKYRAFHNVLHDYKRL